MLFKWFVKDRNGDTDINILIIIPISAFYNVHITLE